MHFKEKFQDFACEYDNFIFDVWGVIHDGSQLYEGVLDALNFLKKENKKICFLSNAPRRSSKVEEVLNKYGIEKNIYDFILTSGEAVFFDFQKNQMNNFKNFGKNYFYIGPKKDMDLLDGLNYKRVDSSLNADFAITTGFDNENSVLEEKLPDLQNALNSKLTLICANPDLIVVKKDGSEMICAGALAKEYEKMNGNVVYYGKPFNSVYQITHELLSFADKSKILAIGDGLETDIKGASDFGIDSVLTTGGILCNKLNIKHGEKADENSVKKICESYKVFPKFIISKL